MLIVKDPEWYLTNQDKPDKILTNIIFLLVAAYAWSRGKRLLAFLFMVLFAASTLFHIRANKETLMIDRIAMVLVFSYFFHMFYPRISFSTYAIIGILLVYYWYCTENVLPFFTYQGVGLLLFLLLHPMNIVTKLSITGLYALFLYVNMLGQGKYHSIKHISASLLAFVLI